MGYSDDSGDPSVQSGVNKGRAVAMKLDASPGKGTEYIEVTFALSATEGETIKWKGWITSSAWAMTEKALKTCGWYGDDIREAMRDGLGLNEVDLVVEWEDYDGKTYAKVAYVNSPGVTGDRAAAIADKVKLLMSKNKEKPKKKAKPESNEAPPSDDSDIPF